MELEELAFAGAVRQAELIRSGEVSSRELVELYLERIERLDPELNAFRTVLAERGLADAPQGLRGPRRRGHELGHGGEHHARRTRQRARAAPARGRGGDRR
jgi:amidase